MSTLDDTDKRDTIQPAESGNSLKQLLEMAKVYRMPKANEWWYIRIPALLPFLHRASGTDKQTGTAG